MFEIVEEFDTQDIEFNSTSTLEVVDAKTTKEIACLRVRYGDNPPELYKQLETRDDIELQKGRDQVRNTQLEVDS